MTCLGKRRLGWWECRAYDGMLVKAVAGLVQMQGCLGKLRTGWWKCRAYAGMLGQAKVGLVEM
jgi:hypothetical protein